MTRASGHCPAQLSFSLLPGWASPGNGAVLAVEEGRGRGSEVKQEGWLWLESWPSLGATSRGLSGPASSLKGRCGGSLWDAMARLIPRDLQTGSSRDAASE